jgi:hypothetical protein
MRFDFRASLLACTLANFCLGCKLKDKVATILLMVIVGYFIVGHFIVGHWWLSY